MSGQKHQPRRYVKKSSKKADSRLMEERGEKRSGSESDAHRGRKQSRLHEHHLVQGAKYIDLRHLEQGEFVATSDMVAGADNYYVPKKETDYVLWNRLNQIDLPARLDETS